ncbi:MAG: hypothetical protein M3H12_03225, partial [Chromatiales bacterium]
VTENLEKSPIIRKQMLMLRLISFLVPFLIAMKKRMSVPILMRMLPSMFGECKHVMFCGGLSRCFSRLRDVVPPLCCTRESAPKVMFEF